MPPYATIALTVNSSGELVVSIGGIMPEPAARAFAVAGVLAAGLLIGGFGAAPVLAQPSDTDGSSQDAQDAGGAGASTRCRQ